MARGTAPQREDLSGPAAPDPPGLLGRASLWLRVSGEGWSLCTRTLGDAGCPGRRRPPHQRCPQLLSWGSECASHTDVRVTTRLVPWNVTDSCSGLEAEALPSGVVGRTGSFWRLWGNSVSRLFSFSEMFHGSWPFLHLLSTSLQPLLLPSASPLPLTSLPPPYQALCEGRLCPWVHSPRPGVTLQASVSPLALIRLSLPHPTRWPLLCCGTLSRPHARRVSGLGSKCSPCARNCTHTGRPRGHRGFGS